jgi:hypothetical protein
MRLSAYVGECRCSQLHPRCGACSAQQISRADFLILASVLFLSFRSALGPSFSSLLSSSVYTMSGAAANEIRVALLALRESITGVVKKNAIQRQVSEMHSDYDRQDAESVRACALRVS